MLHFSTINKWAELFATIIADYVITEAVEPYFERRPRGLIRRKLHPGLRYVDVNLFKPLRSITQRENVIGFIGRLEEEKGIIDFIKIIKIVAHTAKASGIDVKFYIVGGGRLELLVRDMITKLLREGINVKFYGFVEHHLLPSILSEIKILALPYKSHMEGIPSVIMEAFACGTPIVAYDTGLISSIILNGKNGFIVTRNSYRDMATVIIESLKNPETLEIISQSERKTAENLFSFEAAVKRYFLLLRRLV